MPVGGLFLSGRSRIGRFLTIHSVAGQGGPMNLTKELRRIAPSLVPGSRGPGRSRGHERGPGKHIRDHARQRHHGGPGLDGQLQDRSDHVHLSQEERRASSSGSTSPRRPRAVVDNDSTLKPEIVSVEDASGHVIHVQHSKYDPKVAKADKIGDTTTSAVLVNLKVPAKGQPAADYTVQVKGLEGPRARTWSAFIFRATSPVPARSPRRTFKRSRKITA